MKKRDIIIIVVALFILFAILVGFYMINQGRVKSVNSFEECQEAGYPVAESYPRQCFTPDGRGFTEDVPDTGTMCTMDAKECPDGSYVGRVAPDCEFAPCPNED
jgi:hypothetical protein